MESQLWNLKEPTASDVTGMFWTHLDLLEGAVEHGDEHVEEDDHHDDVVDAVEDVARVLDELVVGVQYDGSHLGEAEDGPEQGLEALLHAG